MYWTTEIRLNLHKSTTNHVSLQIDSVIDAGMTRLSTTTIIFLLAKAAPLISAKGCHFIFYVLPPGHLNLTICTDLDFVLIYYCY